MICYDPVFLMVAEALLIEFTEIYYINAATSEYWLYSTDTGSRMLELKKVGNDFFADMEKDVDRVVYEEDRHIFLQDISKENLLSHLEKGDECRIEYRVMQDGKPVYHALSLIRGAVDENDHFVLGIRNVDKEVRERHKAEKNEHELAIYNQIAGSLAAHYDSLYYVDMETDKYFEYSSTDAFKSLNVPAEGDDFFSACYMNMRKYIHPEDKERVIPQFYKRSILENLKKVKSFSLTYRLIVGDSVMHCRCLQIWSSDKKHILVGIENINEEVKAQKLLEETMKEKTAYGRIADSLALRYDVIYYIDCSTGEYSRYSSYQSAIDKSLSLDGKDFFAAAAMVINKQVHPKDRDRILALCDKDYVITSLDNNRQYSADFRFKTNGGISHNRLTIMRSGDKTHFIVGFENIDEEVKKEQEHLEALNRANDLARRDGLTGTRNMIAFREFEASILKSMDSGEGHSPFAVVICDINDLKTVNDHSGHKAGDEYIKSSSRIICGLFAHSPVFRIGGDEFAAVLAGSDYEKRISLVETLRKLSLENLNKNDGPVLAVGIGVYDRLNDKTFSEVFKRADESMYQDKLRLKEGRPVVESSKPEEERKLIPAERKRLLDSMFEMNCISANGMYIYICDMKYDFSRWSKAAVDSYGLPSEYMYGAGDIWEEHIHEEDREAYHNGIADIFAGISQGHDMQYRARRINGEYNVCTCRGIVLKDENGEPDYFAGAIRDHGIQSNIDSLTGLSNQYGFFDEVQSNIVKNNKMRIVLLGIAKFSEINEIYGYHFGNLVLQKVGRFLFEHIGNYGWVYRLDGTKFAILSTDIDSVERFINKYNELRELFRESIVIDDKKIMLELNAGLINVDNFNIDTQTVMTCLSFAYNESKIKKHGDAVVFNNDLGSGKKQRIEKFHAIRASITQEFAGFFLMYQPVVDARTEKLIGAEALLRWKSDEYGVVPPDHFIPLLEQDPIFPSLGEWILTTAVKDAKKLLEDHPDFTVNVNLSYSQIEKADFVDMVMDILERTGYPPEQLCLEVTERCRLLDIDLLSNIVCSLRSRGVKVALDDFGTGFSSIGVVKDLPFDTIKIDRSLVSKIEEDCRERELLKTFVMMAKTCGSSVCVEGIETTGMSEILRQYDVNSFQGYYYSKPLVYDDLIKWAKG